MAKKKITKDIAIMSAASLAVSVLTEQALLAPKKELSVGSFKVPVGGVFALSQDYVAGLAKAALNSALPWYAQKMNHLFNRVDLKAKLKKYILGFVYTFLAQYSLNTIFNIVVKKFGSFDKDTYKDAFSAIVQKYITEKTDRDYLIKSITSEIVRIMRTLTEGTLAALVFNDKFASAISGTIAVAVDRFIENEAAKRLTDFLFSLSGHLDKITIPYLLESALGLGEKELSEYIDMIYDMLLGDKMVAAFSEARYGDAIYDTIKSVDFTKIDYFLKHDMKRDVYQLNLSAMSSAISFYTGATKSLNKARVKLAKARALKNKFVPKRKAKESKVAASVSTALEAFPKPVAFESTPAV